MKLSQIGELKLLREIRERFSSKDQSIIIGIGDDAAVISPQKDKILVTTDMLNEGIHFDLSFASPFHLGFKLVSVNVSDIFAMGGKPKYLLLNIALKNDAEEDIFWKIYEGISAAIDIYNINLVGGDLSSSKNSIVLSATLIGTVDNILTRNNAQAGDKIYVTGTLGDSACGLEILKRLTPESKETVKNFNFIHKGIEMREYREKKLQFLDSEIQINWSDVESLIKRHLMPVPIDPAPIVTLATSMIDISDGLFIDLCRICDESNTGAKIYLDRIPISNEMKKIAEIIGLDHIHLATSGGEDYQLLFTAPETSPLPLFLKGLKEEIRVTCIGEIIEKNRIVIDEKGRVSIMKAKGYEHFGL